MTRFAAIFVVSVTTILCVAFDEAESCGRRRRAFVHHAPCVLVVSPPCSKAAKENPPLTAEDARNALIVYLESNQRAGGPSTLMNVAANRDLLRKELQVAKLTKLDDVYYMAGFHISLAGKWYAIKMVGRGFFEDYRGDFEFDGRQWNARPPELGAIGHFKDKDGTK